MRKWEEGEEACEYERIGRRREEKGGRMTTKEENAKIKELKNPTREWEGRVEGEGGIITAKQSSEWVSALHGAWRLRLLTCELMGQLEFV